MRIAAVNWKIRPVRSDSGFFAHFHDLVSQAHDAGADVVVFPELQVLELLHVEPQLKEKDVPAYLAQYSSHLEDWIQRISASSGMTLVGGSHFRQSPDGIVNACMVAHPVHGGSLGVKNNLTSYERDVWNLTPGSGLLRCPDERIGVTICYDSEFPEAGRALAEGGVLVHCIPAYTETRHGFQRVRWSAHARTIENQIFAVHASLVGSLGREPVPETFGSSAVLSPSMAGFPANSILAETPKNEEGVAIADLNFELLAEVRQTGDVRNWNDRNRGIWRLDRAELPPATTGE